MTYTAREVQQALENHTWTFGTTSYDENWRVIPGKTETYTAEFEWFEAEDSVGQVYNVLGGVKVVDSDPGGEGHGENIFIVFQAVETDQYFRIDGYYASYGDGSLYDGDMYEVRPFEKTVTDWAKV